MGANDHCILRCNDTLVRSPAVASVLLCQSRAAVPAVGAACNKARIQDCESPAWAGARVF